MDDHVVTAIANEPDPAMSLNAGPQASSPAIMRACEACNHKKTKCDMSRPVCGLCQRTGRVCKFPTTRKLPRSSFKRRLSNRPPLGNNLMWLLSLLEENGATNSVVDRRDGSSTALLEHHSSNDESSVNISAAADLQQPEPQAPAHDADRPSQGSEIPNHRSQGAGDQFFDSPVASINSEQQTSLGITPSAPAKTSIPCIPYDLAIDLVETFFEHIQPWLPLLHKPRFLERCRRELNQGPDSLSGLSLEMTLLLTGMFGLAARVSNHQAFTDLKPLDREAQYIIPARQVYAALRNNQNPSLLYLQGCIVLAFHAYTYQLNSPTWILAGVCVRLAYDLGLSEIDGSDGDSPLYQDENDYHDLEEMRRAWWLTWELDTFGSLITRKPFAVDRHHFTVRLPLSDHDWFNANDVQSAELLTTPKQAWKSLQGVENQNPRAWFLIVNHVFSLLFQQLYRKRTDHGDSLMEFETVFNCIKLSWPSSFNILTSPPRFEPETFADCNWMIGMHLMLTTAYSVLDSASRDPCRVATPLSTVSQNQDAPKDLRSVSLSQIVARWPPDYMVDAHPFFVCQLIPTSLEIDGGYPGTKGRAFIDAMGDTAELIMLRFAERWRLAEEALVVLRTLRNPDPETEVHVALRRRFAAFFPREPVTNAQRPQRRSMLNADTPGRLVTEDTTAPHMGLAPTQNQHPQSHAEHGTLQHTQQTGAILQDQDLPSFGMTPSITMPHMALDSEVDQATMYSFSEMLDHPPDNRDLLYGLSF